MCNTFKAANKVGEVPIRFASSSKRFLQILSISSVVRQFWLSTIYCAIPPQFARRMDDVTVSNLHRLWMYGRYLQQVVYIYREPSILLPASLSSISFYIHWHAPFYPMSSHGKSKPTSNSSETRRSMLSAEGLWNTEQRRWDRRWLQYWYWT